MNNKIMNGIILILLIGVLIGVFGQILVKIGLTQIGKIDMPSIKTLFPTVFKMITNKFVFMGLLCSALAAFFWFVVLSRTNLSVSYPIGGGMFYIFLTILSWLILKESISFAQIAGIAVIFLGIIILSK